MGPVPAKITYLNEEGVWICKTLEDFLGELGIDLSGLEAKVDKTTTINGHPLTADVVLDKGDLGLGNVTNTADADKEVSTLQAAAIAQAVSDLKDGVASPGNTLQKLYNLIMGAAQEVTVATIAARNAYNVPSLPCNVLVSDDGDANWALYKATTTGVGASFIKLSDPDLLNAVMSAAAIKSSYESNGDTNAFTNAFKAIVQATSGTNTGDETLATIKAKLGITTLSGSNTGDQDLSGKADKTGTLFTGSTGYGVGAGGAVSQNANKSTGVTLNKQCGAITMNNAALAAAAEISFTLTNSVIGADDIVVVCIKSGATTNTYTVQVDQVAAGSCRICVGNYSTTSRAEAIVISFAVIKGAVT